MTKFESDIARPGDVVTALTLLSRLPIPQSGHGRGAAAAWAYPVAGLILGGMAAMAGAVCHAAGLPSPLAALIVLAFLIGSTGAMHEDGLADTADGLWGGWTADQRLKIMKDSRIGTYGVIALTLSIAARWAALWLLYELDPGAAAAAIMTAAGLSRAAIPALMATLPHARDDGLSHSVGGVQPGTAWLGIAIAAVAAFILSGSGAIGAMIWAAAAALAVFRLARARIGGQTGDILGAAQQVCEIAVLFSLVA